MKAEARRRLVPVQTVRRLIDGGTRARQALRVVAERHGLPEATLRRWWYGAGRFPGVAHADPADYLPLLTPRHQGSGHEAEMSPEAWEVIKSDYLRPEQPALAACYRRLREVAPNHGWVVPSYATIARRIEALPWQVRVLAREGKEALARRLPHITRTKDHLHALQAVNADGHVFDLRVQLPSGTVGRPVLVAWQDIYSGKILAWRVAETLSAPSGADHLRGCGGALRHSRARLPGQRPRVRIQLLTGGSRTRYRFRIREEDPLGLFPQLGVQVHWTTPYHGQAKPIERAFRDLCEGISRHPAAAGAYTGNSPLAKPANYGSRTLAWDEFVRLVDAGIAEHNARPDRRTATARGRSFDATFDESYAASVIRRASAEQRRLWLLAAEGVKVRREGYVVLAGNAYFGEAVSALAGQHVVVRFDPDRLDQPVHVYTPEGAYVGAAERTTARFDDIDTAREHARAHRARQRAARDLHAATVRMEALAEVARLPAADSPPGAPPAPAAVQLVHGPRRGRRAAAAAALDTAEYVAAADRAVLAALAARPRPLKAID
ncbi:Mu transposase C-terminal domain-containing protein [Thermomonas sp. S9]|uniref:transposase domain-containing protein n=1 Tax=Thermomonas sp. S9 TaxID=2885203 RepID=UPI00216B6354|nr:transposase domain-containing protein [Thermomonas sp. S9]MCR6494817.1 Mu transposase C-terminal domain-containing protein [Thermomonas sp. S9]